MTFNFLCKEATLIVFVIVETDRRAIIVRFQRRRKIWTVTNLKIILR
jgi:hypothetical protein